MLKATAARIIRRRILPVSEEREGAIKANKIDLQAATVDGSAREICARR